METISVRVWLCARTDGVRLSLDSNLLTCRCSDLINGINGTAHTALQTHVSYVCQVRDNYCLTV